MVRGIDARGASPRGLVMFATCASCVENRCLAALLIYFSRFDRIRAWTSSGPSECLVLHDGGDG